MVTTIQISDETWKKLNDYKVRGETFEDVIKKHLNQDLNKKEDEQNDTETKKSVE